MIEGYIDLCVGSKVGDMNGVIRWVVVMFRANFLEKYIGGIIFIVYEGDCGVLSLKYMFFVWDLDLKGKGNGSQ